VSERSIKDLTGIGEAINGAIAESDLKKEDLDAFTEYLENQDVLMPLLNPTAYKRLGANGIPLAQARVEVIRKLIEVL
jgi:hypothetical protein